MTPIDKAIKALEPFAEGASHLHPSLPDDGLTLDGIEVRHWRYAAQALSDLSSLKLEDGDVEVACELLRSDRYRNPALGHPSSRPGMFAHNARIDRLLAALGHGGEG